MPSSPYKTDNLADHDAVRALVVNSGFYRHQKLRDRLFMVFSKDGDERDWHALTSTTWEVLFFLIENHIVDATPSITDIPHAVNLSTSTARRQLRKLEKLGLAVTHADGSDKRRMISQLAETYRPAVDAFVMSYSDGFAALIQQHDKQERDIAQQALERTREELEESEALLLQAQKMGSLGHWVWDDVDDKYLMMSEENARIHGLSQKEFLTRGAINYFDDRFTHPDDKAYYQAQVEQADKERRGYDIQYRIITVAGDLRHVREISQPVLNEHGDLVRSIGTTQDITDYVRTEQALKESEQRFRSLLDMSDDLVAVCRLDGARIFVNKAYCEFTGKSEGEMLDGTAGDTFSSCGHKKFLRLIRSLTPGHPSVEGEYKMIRHDGAHRSVLWTERGRFDENGTLLEVHATGRDISS